MTKKIIGFHQAGTPISYQGVSSKSYTHRYMILASLSHGISTIENASICEDTLATAGALRAFGIGVEVGESSKLITLSSKSGMMPPLKPVYCGESGSTLRFMIPQALHFDEWVRFSAGELLSKRPMDSFANLFEKHSIKYDFSNFPLGVKGELFAGDYEIPADVSSQFASGLMMFLASKPGTSTITLTGKVESLDYIKMTGDVIQNFGVQVSIEGTVIKITSKGSLPIGEFQVEGDYSQAAFFIAMGVLANGVDITNLKLKTSQADRRILKAIENMGVRIERIGGMYRIYPRRPKASIFDVSECPDIAPPIALLMALGEGTSKIIGGKRLRYKETDRLHTIATELNHIGARVREDGDTLVIEGVERLSGGVGDSHGDHRIAMMLAAASAKTTGDIILHRAEAVKKSYPNFFDDFVKAGGVLDE